MIIIHKIDETLFEAFPKAKKLNNSINILIEELENYYTYKIIKPKIEIQDNLIIVEINIDHFVKNEKQFNNIVSLCEKGLYEQAKPLLLELIDEAPYVSEYHRILGQIFSDEDNQEDAINKLIDAILWDSKNGYAYTMLGNIYAKFKEDIETATKYYNKALEINQNDFIAINNIGANLMNLGKFEDAERYLVLSNSINDKYPQTLHGLAQVYLQKKEILKSFDYCLKAIKCSVYGDQLFKHTIQLMIEIGKIIANTPNIEKLVFTQKKELEQITNKTIIMSEDNDIQGDAKIEIAEYYNRTEHKLKYKKNTRGIYHLILHEFCHLKFIIEARETDNNKIFFSTSEHKKKFLIKIESFLNKLSRKGFSDQVIKDVTDQMFTGLNYQMFNTPIDLFIEDYLFSSYEVLRPVQFISLYDMYTEYAKGINMPQRAELSPQFIREANTILILIMLYQFKDMFGIDLIFQLKVSIAQKRLAKDLYNEFIKLRNSRKNGLEYDLVEKWANRLGLRNFFELKNERIINDEEVGIDNILSKIENDPYNLEHEEAKQNEGKQISFKDSPAGSMAVTMYCLDALNIFENKSSDEIHRIGFEIATIGRLGIDPGNNEKTYKLATIPDKEFSGLQLLSFMYVAFQHINPDLDSGMDFKNEYEMAKQMKGV